MELRTYLAIQNMTAGKLAKELCVHVNTVYNILNKTAACSLDVALAIEEFTNGQVKVYDLPLRKNTIARMKKRMEHMFEKKMKKDCA